MSQRLNILKTIDQGALSHCSLATSFIRLVFLSRGEETSEFAELLRAASRRMNNPGDSSVRISNDVRDDPWTFQILRDFSCKIRSFVKRWHLAIALGLLVPKMND
eukprot:scaffold516_cov175-Amphora_coffeaeformis.AAC.4